MFGDVTMQEQSTTKVVVKTAVITAAALALVCVMIAVIAFLCFPYGGYKFASDLGMKKTALFFAERYASADNIDGLVYCVSLDNDLMSSDDKDKYAKKLIAHTQDFYEYENVYEYFDQLDKYYLSNSPAQSRVGLFSYNEYVVSSNYVARSVAGEQNKMLFRGEPTSLNDLFVSDVTLIEKATIYFAISKALNYDYDFTVFVSGGSFTDFYYALLNSTPSFVSSLSGEQDQLTVLFLLKSVICLANEMIGYFNVNGVNVSEQWQTVLNYEYNGANLTEAYAAMYINYIANN